MEVKTKLLSATLIAIALYSVTTFAQTPERNSLSDKPQLLEALRTITLETLSFAETVRTTIDRTAFNQDALLDSLNYDAEELIRFVTMEVSYEAYSGVLRGAHGTLLSRAGNSLDQSLLLATLLNDSGYEAVIRFGVLTSADADRLLRGLAHRSSSPAVSDQVAVSRAAAQFQDRLKGIPPLESVGGVVKPPINRKEFMASILTDSKNLLAALASADIFVGKGETIEGTRDEAREYYWVEFRDGPASPWQAIHPAFGGNPSPDVDIAETYAGQVPAERTHRLRLELFVDQRIGAEVHTKSLMAPIDFPSANVSGQTISLVLLPDTLLRHSPLAEGGSPRDGARFLIPLVNQGLPDGAMAMRLNGSTVPPDLIQLSATGVFETVSERIESAASALRGLGSDESIAKPILAIESVRLQLTLLSPGSGSRTIERFLYKASDDALVDATTERSAIVTALARAHSIGFAAGSLAEGYVIEEKLADLLHKAPLIRAMLDPAVSACDSLECLPHPKLDAKPVGDNVTRYLAEFDQAIPKETGSLVYRDAPNVVRVSVSLLPTSFELAAIDIMANSRRAFRFEDGTPLLAPELVLSAGVAETHSEAAIAGVWAPGPRIRARADDHTSALRARLEKPPLPPEAHIEESMISRALQVGSVIVTAAVPGDSAEAPLSWWEVDPITGRTLAMTRYGGASVSEWIQLGVGIGGAVLGGTAGFCFFKTLSIDKPDPNRGIVRRARDFPRPGLAWETNVTGCAFCIAELFVGGLTGEGTAKQYFDACMSGNPP